MARSATKREKSGETSRRTRSLANSGRSRQPALPAAVMQKDWPAALVLLVTFLAYCPTLRFQFVYDDLHQVVGNPNLTSWDRLPDYFTKHLWSHADWYQVRFYRPLFLVWLRLNYWVFGLKPAGWHLTTIAAHLLATLLVYLLVRRLLEQRLPAFFAGLFFGLHPIHVQVVAWVSSASEALLTAALLVALLCYLGKERNHFRIGPALTFFTIALLLKETAMMFPALIFVVALLFSNNHAPWPRVRFAFGQTLPFLGVTAVYLAVRWAILGDIVTVTTPIGFKTALLTIPSILCFYGRLLVWPHRLGVFYDNNVVSRPDLTNFLLPLIAVLTVSGLMALLLWRLKPAQNASESAHTEWRTAVLSCAWVLFLLPALDLPALEQELLVQDRYLYIPSIGLVVLLALGLNRLRGSSRPVPGLPARAAIPALLIAAGMALGTISESQTWKSNLALFTRGVERAPHSRIAQHDLAAALLDDGRFDQAINLLRMLLTQDPNDPADNNNIAQAYLRKGDPWQGEAYLAKFCQLRPNSPSQLYQLGAIRFNSGRVAEATQNFRKAISLNPAGAGYHYALGVALEQQGDLTGARVEFQRELALNPVDSTAQQALLRVDHKITN
jgi:protein O-mannosyl-transferase